MRRWQIHDQHIPKNRRVPDFLLPQQAVPYAHTDAHTDAHGYANTNSYADAD